LGFLGILGILRDRKTRFIGVILLGWWLAPLLVQTAIAKVFTARYILFSVPLFVLFAVYGLDEFQIMNSKPQTNPNPPVGGQIPMIQTIWNWVVGAWNLFGIGWLVLGILWSLYFDWQLWFNPIKAPLPKDDYAGYMEGWTSGWGIKEVANYLKNLPRDRSIIVGTEGFFGTLPDGLQIYLEGEKGITVIGVGYPIKAVPESLVNAKKAGDRVYLVVNQSRLEMEDSTRLRLVGEYQKPGGDKLLFFEI
jgi:hypothetical protein